MSDLLFLISCGSMVNGYESWLRLCQIWARWLKASSSLIACFSTPVDKAEYAKIDCYANFEDRWTICFRDTTCENITTFCFVWRMTLMRRKMLLVTKHSQLGSWHAIYWVCMARLTVFFFVLYKVWILAYFLCQQVWRKMLLRRIKPLAMWVKFHTAI